MIDDLEELISGWDGLAVVVRRDRPTGAWIFIALHDDTLGAPMGGTRMKSYPTPAEGLLDAMRLAEGMTHKWAAADLPMGGGKAVIALDRPLAADERDALLGRYGRLVNALRGTFATGQDLGTTPADMARIGRETRYVHGLDGDSALDPGPFTARGVFNALRAVVRQLDDGGDDLEGKTVLIEGVGSVGAPLARQVAAARGEVVLADLDAARAQALADELGGRVVALDDVVGTPCDVYAPCAVGGTLNAETISRLACRAVCGSANNQLGEAADAEALHRRGILYAPDYIANSGGAIKFALLGRHASDEEIDRRLDGIGTVIEEVLAEADRDGTSPLAAARRRVERLIGR